MKGIKLSEDVPFSHLVFVFRFKLLRCVAIKGIYQSFL